MSAGADDSRRSRRSFAAGFMAGATALVFGFILRLGGMAPYPPESAFQLFLRVVPASVEEPAVQRLGDFAGLLGLVVASAIAACVYGLLAVVFDRSVAPRLARRTTLTPFEWLLVYALVPWSLFGLVILPMSGDSVFGLGSAFASQGSLWVFPLTLLLTQGVFSLALYSNERSRMAAAVVAPSQEVGAEPSRAGLGRRTFIERGALIVASLIAGGVAVMGAIPFGGSTTASSMPQGSPIDLQGAPAIFSDPRLAPLVDAEVTSDAAFYRVAIDLFDPSVDASTWSLQVTGMVKDGDRSYSLPELKTMPKASQYTTFECVSNVVNGNLIGNAAWSGVRLSDILNDAGGTSQGAGFVVFYSVDGYSVAVPLSKAMMPDTLLAYEMNGADLPTKHGYPLRAVIPGLYGMMSAKWVNKVEVSGSPYEGYWQTRGWSSVGTVQTLAFISIPAGASPSLSQYGGTVMLGGVAFAGDRGISRVEVSVDGGKTWDVAQLKPPVSDLTWVIWAYEWRPTSPGDYTVYARATDGKGATQTSTATDPFPNGATGYVAVPLRVTE